MKKILSVIALLLILLLNSVKLSYSEEGKDHIKAFFMSFALPGLGQYYAGSPGNAKTFIVAELALWSGYYYNLLINKSYRNDYFAYAASHAGVNPSGFGTSYLNAVGGYNSSFEYNSHQLQITDNPVLYSGEMMWDWDTRKNRSHFKYLRERELDYKNNARYCLAGIILNHFLCGLNASKLVQQSNEKRASLTVDLIDTGLAANYSWSF